MTAIAPGYALRDAAPGDEAVIARQRAAMFRDMGLCSESEAEQLADASEPWLLRLLQTGEYRGWLVVSDDRVVAGGGVLLQEMGPVPGCVRVGRLGHIANIYTEPSHRQRGLARVLMETILTWTEANHLDHVTLSASEDGKRLYASLGFTPTPHMRREVRRAD